MSVVAPIISSTGMPATGAGHSGNLQTEISSTEFSDGAQFREALERHTNARANDTFRPNKAGESASLGDKIMGRATTLASEVQKDQQYVSRLLEQATRNADTAQLMKAMMALNDYQLRVQFISKTASKATSSLDQLTKLQ